MNNKLFINIEGDIYKNTYFFYTALINNKLFINIEGYIYKNTYFYLDRLNE